MDGSPDPRKLQAACQLSPKKSEFAELKGKLANASAETILTESKNLNKVSIDVKGKSYSNYKCRVKPMLYPKLV